MYMGDKESCFIELNVPQISVCENVGNAVTVGIRKLLLHFRGN